MQSAPASVSAAIKRPRPVPEETDQHVILYGMTWKDYETLLAMRGDRTGVRLFYLNGAIELMSPTRSHEGIKTTLGRLLEAYCEEQNIDLDGYGSWTLRSAPEERGAEPDECYMVGSIDKEVPDLAFEVVWSHGGLDKLEIYRGLGVAEVWVWDRDAGLRVFALRDGRYAQATGSKFFPDLDLAWFATFLDQPTQTQAVRALRAAMR
jgi:Uma2 family endonuclease